MTWYIVNPHYRLYELTVQNEGYDLIDWDKIPVVEGDENALTDWVDNIVSDDDVNDYIDDCNDDIEICGISYSPSYVLEEIDPYAWSEIRDEYVNIKVDDYLYERPKKPVTYGDLSLCNGIWYDDGIEGDNDDE